MTEIEHKALALVNEVFVEGGGSPVDYYALQDEIITKALCRAIEQHEAFRREVSDAVEHYASRWPANARRDIFMSQFASFIIAKPVDPLVEAFADLGFTDFAEGIEEFRAALAARGLEIREVQP